MIKIIKFLIGKKLIKSFIFLKNKNYIPFTLRSFTNPETLYSDFFVFDTKSYKYIFIAENIFSLLNKTKLEVEHKFKFYSKDGIFFQVNLIKVIIT